MPQQISPLRLSFVGALKILRCRLPECSKSRPALGQWFANLVAEVGEEIIDKRRDRVNPWTIEQKMNRWPKNGPNTAGTLSLSHARK